MAYRADQWTRNEPPPPTITESKCVICLPVLSQQVLLKKPLSQDVAKPFLANNITLSAKKYKVKREKLRRQKEQYVSEKKTKKANDNKKVNETKKMLDDYKWPRNQNEENENDSNNSAFYEESPSKKSYLYIIYIVFIYYLYTIYNIFI